MVAAGAPNIRGIPKRFDSMIFSEMPDTKLNTYVPTLRPKKLPAPTTAMFLTCGAVAVVLQVRAAA